MRIDPVRSTLVICKARLEKIRSNQASWILAVVPKQLQLCFRVKCPVTIFIQRSSFFNCLPQEGGTRKRNKRTGKDRRTDWVKEATALHRNFLAVHRGWCLVSSGQILPCGGSFPGIHKFLICKQTLICLAVLLSRLELCQPWGGDSVGAN